VDYIFLVVAVLWAAQFGMAWWQLRRFHGRIATLRREGRTAVGMQGNRFSGRTYAVLVADPQGRIHRAEIFDGWTVFSHLRPVAELEGRHLSALKAEQPVAGVRKTQWQALQHAAGFLEQAPKHADAEVASAQA
jgi:DNA-binding transcriptional regulator of glucitol operon